MIGGNPIQLHVNARSLNNWYMYDDWHPSRPARGYGERC